MRVDVLVTDGGRPVLGLGPADFEVLDNGVPQDVEFVSYDQIPLNVVLAFDMSDSVAGERLEHLRSAGSAVLAGLKRNDQAALVDLQQSGHARAALTAISDRSARRSETLSARAIPRSSTASTPASRSGSPTPAGRC